MDEIEPLLPGEEVLYQRWVRIRSRLEVVLGKQSGLPAPLSAYAIDHASNLNLTHIEFLRDEYGVAGEPPAADLLALLAEEEYRG